jgi:Concanavalin A-like lectin/glucanases superfamily
MMLGITACAGNASIEPPTTVGPMASAVAGVPEPVFAWALHGNGDASAGGVQLEFSGSHNLGADSVAFDGVTGSAASRDPALIDTTKSFSVAAWVSLDHEAEHAVAVSEIGEVAAAFYLGYTGSEWSFNVKSADAPGGNAYAKVRRPHDPAAWVHLVGVYDESAGQIRLYLDGERVAESAFKATWHATGPLTVGRSLADGAPADFWPGSIADVQVYDVALDDAQVRSVRDVGRRTSAPAALPEVPAGFHCPPGGGRCLGPLAPGRYTTEIFSPSITYTVPEGWTNGEDLLGNFLLQLEDDPRFLGIYRNITVPLPCREEPDPEVGVTIDALSDWYTSHPGLVTTGPEPITIGGLAGVVTDVSLDPSWTNGCAWAGGQPSVGIIIGDGPSSLTHVLSSSGPEERLYLLQVEDGNVAIEVGPEGESLEDYLEVVTPIIEGIRFGK